MNSKKIGFTVSQIAPALWWFGCMIVWIFMSNTELLNTAFVPSPRMLTEAIVDQSVLSVLIIDTWYTLSRLITSIVLGYIISILLILIGIYIPSFMRFISQVMRLAKYIPPPVLIPLTIVFAGIQSISIVYVSTLASIILLTQYMVDLVQNEEQRFTKIQESWKITRWNRFGYFVLPLIHALSYRILGILLLWTFGLSIFTEIILSTEFGLGVRLVQYQQLYQTGPLYISIVWIIALAFGLEKLFVRTFSQFIWTPVRIIIVALLGALIGASTIFVWVSNNEVQDPSKTIVSYSASVNTPLYVMVEKYNSLDMQLNIVSSGIQSVDALQAGQASIAGFADMPNAMSAVASNSNLKFIAQAIETKDSPSLFFITRPEFGIDLTSLRGQTVGYFPNNPLIKNGLDFTLFQRQAPTTTLEYTSSQDPTVLNTALIQGNIGALLTIEPFATELESQGMIRFNPSESLIASDSFNNIPIAAMIIDQTQFDEDELKTLQDSIEQTLEFISQAQDDSNIQEELNQITAKYQTTSTPILTQYQTGTSIESDAITQILSLLKLYGSNSTITLPPDEYYIAN